MSQSSALYSRNLVSLNFFFLGTSSRQTGIFYLSLYLWPDRGTPLKLLATILPWCTGVSRRPLIGPPGFQKTLAFQAIVLLIGVWIPDLTMPLLKPKTFPTVTQQINHAVRYSASQEYPVNSSYLGHMWFFFVYYCIFESLYI